MRLKRATLFVLIVGCGFAATLAAEERSGNQEEWTRRTNELMHPNPGSPRLEAIATAKYLRARECVIKFIAKNASPIGDSKKLTEQACQSCDGEITASGIAGYEDSRIKTPMSAVLDESIKHSKESCRRFFWLTASEAIFDKQFEIEKHRKETLNVEYLGKIKSATACGDQAALVYALSTTETAEAVATAAFNKCNALWNEAAEVALKLHPTLSEFDRRDALHKGWMDHGVSTVVDLRARQRLRPSLPADEKRPETKQEGTKI